jgi:aldose sugar dehydrogenase
MQQAEQHLKRHSLCAMLATLTKNRKRGTVNFPPSKKITLLILLIFMIPTQAQNDTFTDITGTEYRVETYIEANFPVGMAFAPDGRLFYNEKVTGNVRVVLPDGTRQIEPVITLPTEASQERGMLGIALSPNFETDNTIYVVHTVVGDAQNFPANRLVRFVIDENNQAQSSEELLRVPIETGQLLHNGGNVHFDEDGYLYLSLGDYGDATFSQNLDTPQGAIHRFMVTEEGLSIPEDNPFGNNSIYAYGFRNPFDFTFDPFSDWIFASEVGQNCDDEIDVVFAGGNYGWNDQYDCVGTDGQVDYEDYIAPMLSYAPAITPTGIVVYDGDAFPEWQGNLIFCDWNFGTMRRVVLDETRTQALEVFEIDLGDASCKLDLLIGPEGSVYFGTLGGGGSLIMRLLPVN